MKRFLPYITSAFLLVIIQYVTDNGRSEPLHFEMRLEYDRIVVQQEVCSFVGVDSFTEHTLQLLLDEDQQPLLFYADIITPVCIDNVCKPMYIQIYWNLVGEYVGYGLVENNLLSKFDHDPFESTDYKKLHDLLLDKHSILERRKLSDLFDPGKRAEKAIEFNGEKVDALSGATKREIKESVVEGALYSCYTAWHLVHGVVVQQMVAYIDSVYSPVLADDFIHSPYPTYQMYALKNFSAEEFEVHLPRIVEVFKTSKPLTRTYIVKKLPEGAWRKDTVTLDFFRNFASLDANTKTLLIDRLDIAHQDAAEIVAPFVREMSKNQLKTYLGLLNSKPDLVKEGVRQELEGASLDQTYAHSYLIADFLHP